MLLQQRISIFLLILLGLSSFCQGWFLFGNSEEEKTKDDENEKFPLTEEDFLRSETLDDAELVARYPKYGGPLQAITNVTVDLDQKSVSSKRKVLFKL